MQNPFTPRAGRPRKVTDLNQKNGQFLHPPRLPEIGGANSLHKPGGPVRNSLKIVKPAGTR